MTLLIDIKKIYCFFFPLCFILNGYASPIPGISLGMFILVIFTFISVFFALKKRLKYDHTPFIVLWFYIFITFINLLLLRSNQININNLIISISKLIVWAVSIGITSYTLFDKQSITKWMIRFSIICTGYLILQYIFFYFFSIYLPNIFNIPFIPPYNADYLQYSEFINYSYFRPSSFFSEPAFYANFIMITLVMFMFDKSIKHYKQLVIFFTLGIFLSTSTAGILLTIPLQVLFIIKNYSWKKMIPYLIIGIMGCSLFIVYINTRTDAEIMNNKFLATIKYTINKTDTMSDSRRVGDSFDYLIQLTNLQKLHGIGIGNEKNFFNSEHLYLNSITFIITTTGYIGLIIFLIFLSFKFIKIKYIGSKYLIICYLIKCFASSLAFGVYGILYLSIAFYLEYEYRKEYYINVSVKKCYSKFIN